MSPTVRPPRKHDDASSSSVAACRPLDDPGSDECSPIALNRMERRVLDKVRRDGTVRFVATMTVFTALTSALLAVAAGWSVFGIDPEVLPRTLLIALVVPSFVAPPMFHFAIALTARLDAAGELLRRAALTDPLTGVLNRRGFFEAVEDAELQEQEADVAMIDIDQFKQLNDRHGHATGDQALTTVSDWLVELGGESGLVSRLGGDEFALVVPADGEPPWKCQQELLANDVPFSVTIGSARYSGAESFTDALARADAALYVRKKQAVPSAPLSAL